MSAADPTLPAADRLAAVLADADLRHRNPAAANMVATTSVQQANDLRRVIKASSEPDRTLPTEPAARRRAIQRWGW